MDQKKEIQKELESISPLLAKIERSDSPEVPYLYFDKLADKVLDQVEEINTKPTWWHTIASIFTTQRTLAFASVAILVVAAILLFQPTTDTVTDPFANLNDEDINNYIAMNVDEFDESFFYDYTNLSNIEEGQIEGELNDSNIDELMDKIIDEVDLELIEEFL